MSIEIGSEFSEIIVKEFKDFQEFRKNNSNNIHTLDRGISYIRSEWADAAEDLEVIRAVSPLKPAEELIQFRKDPDYEDDVCNRFNFGGNVSFDNVSDGFDNRFDSLLPYDYETDVVDVLNLDEQIAAYAAESWEFVSITDNIILFQKPKWEA